MEHGDESCCASRDGASDGQNTQILSEYYNLTSRRVDLVGDYAGSELFLIDGESLLLRCFNDRNLDFENGFQLLHAVFLVEQFLHGLRLRKCTFNIVFFDSNRRLCIPGRAESSNAAKYLFARAAVIRHLSSTLPDACPELSIRVFESWTSASFSRYLQESSPYFIMMHDGAQNSREVHQNASVLRQAIIHFIASGYNIALINELQWQDTKIMVSVLEPRKHLKIASINAEPDLPIQVLPNDNLLSQVQKIKTIIINPSERQILAIVTVSSILRNISLDISVSVWTEMCTSFLLHQALISHLPLSARRFPAIAATEIEKRFLQEMASVSDSIVSDLAWSEAMSSPAIAGQIADYVDGRLFLQVARNHIQSDVNTHETFLELRNAVETLLGADMPFQHHVETGNAKRTATKHCSDSDQPVVSDLKILPFSSPIFDKHLAIVCISVENARMERNGSAGRKVFQEASHWHNAQRHLVQKVLLVKTDAYQAKRAAIRNQRFMAEMQKYAASLTNAVGKSLEPEVIVSKQIASSTTITKSKTLIHQPESSNAGTRSYKDAGNKGGAKNKRKNDMALRIALEQSKKSSLVEEKSLNAWKSRREEIEKLLDPEMRYLAAQKYLINLPSERNAAGAQCELYMVTCLVSHLHGICQPGKTPRFLDIAAIVWYHLWLIIERRQVSKSSATYMTDLVAYLNLPHLPPIRIATTTEASTFSFSLPRTERASLEMSTQEFLLQHCGPYLERSFDPKPDKRVGFSPDLWQRKVLDSIDSNESAFVIAPTSAGKTFISFYAMRKVLEADDDGVLVYVAPTKALVNQIAAEIQARFSKTFKHPGKSVWAIHTRDFRINNPNGCQVLVTVPHMLQIMLLSPTNAKTWSTRIKYIIFDEIHSLGQAEDGVVWEQLLLMAPCPIIALSATVGNPSEFAEWLESTQASIGVRLNTISHPHRYSDLRKYYHTPSKDTKFTGLPPKILLDHVGLDSIADLKFIHPVAALVDRSRGIPEDLALEPRDCFSLWQAMKEVENDEFNVSPSLDPAVALPSVCRKQDVLAWEQSLKEVLRRWLNNSKSPFNELIERLGHDFLYQGKTRMSAIQATCDAPLEVSQSTDDLLKTTLPLLCQLHEQNALPALLFNYNREYCEKICGALLDELIASEDDQIKKGIKWQQKLDEWQDWKIQKEKADLQQRKENQKARRKQTKSALGDNDKLSKIDLQRDSMSTETDKWERFNPDEPQPGYHFADYTKMQANELREITDELRARDIDHKLISALTRGIGVHHAGMNRKYRQVVEMLFRRRFLHVVIATGTLALGINMPCKTVVFSGDSIYLTALNYRQCAGRAGRRGFDLLGNVVFQNISRQKVCRLISSRLPSLNGHFPITTSFVLRLFILLHGSQNSTFAVNAIDSVLSQPRLYMGGDSFKEQTMHHLRFSIEYLRQQNLLSDTGIPINFAGLVSHLYYTENSAFAFHALMKQGLFTSLCKKIVENEEDTLLELMLVMSHLFCRIAIRSADHERRTDMIKGSSSMIFLPELPEAASKTLQDHNTQTQAVFEAYVRTYVDQHVSVADDALPLTGVRLGGNNTAITDLSLAPARVRSSFIALSGLGDTFTSINDLCSSVRSGVFLEESVIPYIQTQGKDTDVLLNAYLLDFFKHGDIVTLEKHNGVRRSDIWFHLNDFSLILATIVTSIINLMGLHQGEEIDMLDLQGEMDVLQESGDDEADSYLASGKPLAELTTDPSTKETGRLEKGGKASSSKRAKVPDSWDDDDNDDEEDDEEGKEGIFQNNRNSALEHRLMSATTEPGSSDSQPDEDLRNVLTAFKKLQEKFNEKFKAMWA